MSSEVRFDIIFPVCYSVSVLVEQHFLKSLLEVLFRHESPQQFGTTVNRNEVRNCINVSSRCFFSIHSEHLPRSVTQVWLRGLIANQIGLK